jgi:hypothetical protein
MKSASRCAKDVLARICCSWAKTLKVVPAKPLGYGVEVWWRILSAADQIKAVDAGVGRLSPTRIGQFTSGITAACKWDEGADDSQVGVIAHSRVSVGDTVRSSIIAASCPGVMR